MLRSSVPLFLFLLAAGTSSAHAAPPVPDSVQGCRSCHKMDATEEDRWGPDLRGILGRPMGAEAGYRYGPYLRTQHTLGTTWTESALRAWLVDSKAVAKASGTRTKMPAQHLTDDQLDEVITYLRTVN